eukprot:GHVU01086258.1.p3 GENE.GHVU01086258.1~~GHVU01086258.1.p3  ORF type:complete len:101 (+),score=9.13 GHVU01086258.1:1389-1691(+)
MEPVFRNNRFFLSSHVYSVSFLLLLPSPLFFVLLPSPTLAATVGGSQSWTHLPRQVATGRPHTNTHTHTRLVGFGGQPPLHVDSRSIQQSPGTTTDRMSE